MIILSTSLPKYLSMGLSLMVTLPLPGIIHTLAMEFLRLPVA
jgi:hypothetical protein